MKKYRMGKTVWKKERVKLIKKIIILWLKRNLRI
jgi:hypothetical protein